MNERMLAYCLTEAEIAVRIMQRDRSNLHMFDYGTTPDGTKYVFVMAIVPEELANRLASPAQMVDSKPLTSANASRAAEPNLAGGKA